MNISVAVIGACAIIGGSFVGVVLGELLRIAYTKARDEWRRRQTMREVLSHFEALDRALAKQDSTTRKGER